MNASAYFAKKKPKNVLTDAGIAAVAGVYRAWETREKLSRVITLAEARAADYNLSPSQFVEVNDRVRHRLLPDILGDLAVARAAREAADADLNAVLAKLGLTVQRDRAPAALEEEEQRMKRRFTASIWREGDWFVAQCLEVDVASQGESEDEALGNLREALELHFAAARHRHAPPW